MIVAKLVNAYDGSSLGEWSFPALPRVGEQVTLRSYQIEQFDVVSVEYWPADESIDPDELVLALMRDARTVIRVEANGTTY